MKLNEFKSLTSSLDQFSHPLQDENASLNPEQTAELEKTIDKIITFTESHHLDFGAQGKADLDSLNSLSERASVAFTQALTIKPLEQKCSRLAKAILSIKKTLQKENVIRLKTELLGLLKIAKTEDEFLYIFEQIQKSSLFEDPDFLFKTCIILAVRVPAFFCDNIDLFPLQDEHTCLQIGALLNNADHQVLFARNFKLNIKTLKAKHAELAKNEKKLVDKLLGLKGLCFGYTLALISLLSSNPNAALDQQELFRKARFIQAGYDLNSISLDHDVVRVKQIGTCLLADEQALEKFPTVLAKAASILGFQTAEDLIKASKESNHLPFLVGEVVIKVYPTIVRQMIKQRGRDENSALEKEYFQLKDLLSSKVPPKLPLTTQDLHEKGSAPSVRNLKLKQHKPLLDNIPLGNLISSLSTLKKPKGHCELGLLGPECNHAIYLSFDTLTFCDINNIDLITKEPILRGPFQTPESMAHALRQHILLAYEGKGQFHAFSLTPYSRK